MWAWKPAPAVRGEEIGFGGRPLQVSRRSCGLTGSVDPVTRVNGTRYQYETSLRLHVEPYFGATAIGAVKPKHLNAWLKWMVDERDDEESTAINRYETLAGPTIAAKLREGAQMPLDRLDRGQGWKADRLLDLPLDPCAPVMIMDIGLAQLCRATPVNVARPAAT